MVTFIVGRYPEKIMRRVLKINVSIRSLVERLCEFKIYAISVLSFISSVCDPDKATLKTENLQCTTAEPYNAIPSNLLGVGSICGLCHSISLVARYRVAACSTTLNQGLEKIQAAGGHNFVPIFVLSLDLEQEILFPSTACSTEGVFLLFVAWTMMENLMKSRRIGSRMSPQDHYVTNFVSRVMLDQSLYGLLKFWDRSDVIELRTSCST